MNGNKVEPDWHEFYTQSQIQLYAEQERVEALENALRQLLKYEWIMSRSWGGRQVWDERKKAIAEAEALLGEKRS